MYTKKKYILLLFVLYKCSGKIERREFFTKMPICPVYKMNINSYFTGIENRSLNFNCYLRNYPTIFRNKLYYLFCMGIVNIDTIGYLRFEGNNYIFLLNKERTEENIFINFDTTYKEKIKCIGVGDITCDNLSFCKIKVNNLDTTYSYCLNDSKSIDSFILREISISKNYGFVGFSYIMPFTHDTLIISLAE